MFNYLKSKDYVKAIASSDAAILHEDTKNGSKTWMYRGNIFKAIYSDTSKKVRDIDLEAEEKALEAFINCLKFDKDVIYKDEVKGSIVIAASATRNKANYYKQNKEFDKAINCFNLLEMALPYDFDKGIKRNNITKEKIIFDKFELYKFSANKEKTKEFANLLIEANYKDPKIYTDMVKISLMDRDTLAALSFIEKGKIIFEENIDLITFELEIYIARKKTDILKDKIETAIEVTPDNEILHLILANLFKGTNNFEAAEKEYLKAIEIKSDYEPANYNLAVLYYSAGKKWNDKLNALSLKDPKQKEYETKSNDYFKKAVVYFEISFNVTKDKSTKQQLRQLFLRLGDNEKAEKYK